MSSVNQHKLLSLIEENTFSWIDTFLKESFKMDENGLIETQEGVYHKPDEVLFKIDENDKNLRAKINRVKTTLAKSLETILNRTSSFEESDLIDEISKQAQIPQTTEYEGIIAKAILAYGTKVPHYGTEDYIDNEKQANNPEDNNELNDIVHLGPKEFGLFTTRKALYDELELIRMLVEVNPNHNFKCDRDLVDAKIRENVLISQEQAQATRACTETESQVSGCFGLAGAGKSTTANTFVQVYKELGYQAVGIALSWLAAKVLEIETSMSCFSVASFINEKEQGGDNAFDQKTLLIIDEAGLVNINDLKRILQVIKKSKYAIKLILSGDPTQLNPINGSNALELAEAVLPKDAQATISTIRRQNSPSHREAVKLLRTGNSGEALYLFNQQEAIKIKDNQHDMVKQVVEDYFTSLKEHPEPNYKLLTIAMNHGVIFELNQKIREVMIQFGRVDKATEIKIPVYRKSNVGNLPPEESFAVGDQIIFLKTDKRKFLKDVNTDKQYNVFLSNNTVGKIVQIKNAANGGYDIRAHVEIENDQRQKVTTYIDINTKNYVNADRHSRSAMRCAIGLNYATTAYASQGQTVQHCLFLDDGQKMMNRRYAYVVCSRHKEKLSIYINKEKITNEILNSKTYKPNENDNEYSVSVANIKTVDILNKVGFNWGKPDEKKSIIIKFLDVLNDIKKMKYQEKMLPEFSDINNLPENFSELYKEFKFKERLKENQKYFYQPPKDKSLILLDSEEYYQTKPEQVDITFKQNLSNPNFVKYDLNAAPVVQKQEYQLSNILDTELFKALKGEYFDIGRGGEIRFIAKTRNLNGKNDNDVVISKYDLFGNDALNIGYPFFISGGNNSNNNNKILICQDLNEFLNYMKEYYLDRKDYTHSPTLIWGTPDTRYHHMIKRFDNSNVFLIGDKEFQNVQKDRILNCIDGYNVHNITFPNSSIKEELNNKKGKSLDSLMDDLDLDIDLSNTLSPVDNKNTNTQNKTENNLVDKYGNLNTELLTYYLKENKIFTDEQIDKRILPTKLNLDNQVVVSEEIKSSIISNRKVKM